jgi:hypothetical protein
MQVTQLENLLKMYKSSFKSRFTARAYTTHLKKYSNGDLVSLLTNLTQREAEDRLIDFMITNKENGMAWGALHNYVAAVAKFYLIMTFHLISLELSNSCPRKPELIKIGPIPPRKYSIFYN